MSRFHDDDAAQKAVRDAVLGPGLYGPHSKEGRYVYLDKGRLATLLQKRYAVDTFWQRLDGRATAVEEKIVRWPPYGRAYADLVLETRSCTVPGHESPGWMEYGQADLLNYALCQANGDVLCLLMPFPILQEKFWPVHEQFEETITEQHNRTACRKVPIKWIEDNVGLYRKLIRPTPEGAEIVKAYNSGHYKIRIAGQERRVG